MFHGNEMGRRMCEKLDEQLEAIKRVLVSKNLSLLHGNEVNKFEREFREMFGVKYAIAVNSGTAALHLSLLSLGIGEGDEVIVPAITFLSTASAVVMTGATPVFVDVSLDDYTMDMDDVFNKITENTVAIIPVHLAGIPANLGKLSVFKDHRLRDIYIIEDACQALGSKYHGKYVGTIEDVGCFSFYAGKILSTGEGGMIVTNDESIAKRCVELRNHGKVDDNDLSAYRLGFNYRMTEIAGALGRIGLKHLPEKIEEAKRRLKNIYYELKLMKRNMVIGIMFPEISSEYSVVTTYIPIVGERKLDKPHFYPPLYKIPFLRKYYTGECANAEIIYKYAGKIPLREGEKVNRPIRGGVNKWLVGDST